MTLFINYTGNNLSITFCTVCNPCLFSSLHLSLIRYRIFFQTKLLSRLSPRFCRFLSSHFRPKGSQICIFIYNTRQISWNTCVYFPQCFKIRLTQHWGGRTHISGGKTVWRINLKIFPENSRETVSVSTICDEYCLCVWRAWTGNVNVGWVIIVACSGYVRSVLVLTVLDMK